MVLRKWKKVNFLWNWPYVYVLQEVTGTGRVSLCAKVENVVVQQEWRWEALGCRFAQKRGPFMCAVGTSAPVSLPSRWSIAEMFARGRLHARGPDLKMCRLKQGHSTQCVCLSCCVSVCVSMCVLTSLGSVFYICHLRENEQTRLFNSQCKSTVEQYKQISRREEKRQVG